MSKEVIGWREWVALPDLGVDLIKTKVDTGARTSALHAFDIEHFKRKNQDWVRFCVHPIQRNDEVIKACTSRVHDSRAVTNSGGSTEHRWVITTIIVLGDESWPIELTLTNRDEMGFRMLIGRTAINGRFMVDPSQSYCRGRPNAAVDDQSMDRSSKKYDEEE
jgi:hypothetical protein